MGRQQADAQRQVWPSLSGIAPRRLVTCTPYGAMLLRVRVERLLGIAVTPVALLQRCDAFSDQEKSEHATQPRNRQRYDQRRVQHSCRGVNRKDKR